MNRRTFFRRSIVAAALAVLPMPKREEIESDDPVEIVEFGEWASPPLTLTGSEKLKLRWIRRRRIDFSKFPVEPAPE